MSNNTLNLILASEQPILFKALLKKGEIDYKELLHYLIRNSSIKVAKDANIVQFIYNSIIIELAKADRSKHWGRLCIGFPEKETNLTSRPLSDFTPEQESIFRRMKLQQDQDIRNNPELLNNSLS